MEKRGGKFLVINMEPKDKAATPAIMSSDATLVHQPKWKDIMQIMVADYRDYTAGIAIDGLMGYARECMYDVIGVSNNPRMNVGQSHIPHQNQWHIWGERLRNHVDQLVQKDIPVIATGHIQFTKDELSGEVYKTVNMWGKPAVELPAMFTVAGVCEYVSAQKEAWNVKFRPERGFPARDTLGKLDAREPADFAAMWKKLTA